MSENIFFNHESRKWENITVEQVRSWESAYPSVNVIDIITKRMPLWLDANPKKARKKQWKRFIVGWLSREQGQYKGKRKEA